MVYEESDTDMLVAMPLPLTDLFQRRALALGEVRRAGPPRPRPHGLLGLGQPARGTQGARPDGAPGRGVRRARRSSSTTSATTTAQPFPWRMDDPQDRVPGVREGPGARRQPDRRAQGRAARPAADRAHPDLGHGRRAAANFPDINFVIYHVGLPFIDETCWQLIRYPNLYASLAATVNFVVRAPRHVRRDPRQAAVLVRRGQDRLRLRGADLAPAVGAARRSWTSRSRRTSCDGYGYPQLTDQAKRKILGENLLRLHGMDVEATRAGAAA